MQHPVNFLDPAKLTPARFHEVKPIRIENIETGEVFTKSIVNRW